MRQFYMDTNVFISRIKPDDPYHSEAKVITKSLENDEVHAETSVLSLLEMASVTSRLYKARRIRGGADRERMAFIIETLKRFAALGIRFIHVSGDSPIAVRNIHATMPSIFNEAIILSLQTTLRTFDLIHLAAAKYAKQTNHELGAFVTGDREFLSRKDELSKIMEMPILSPKEYMEGLGLRK